MKDGHTGSPLLCRSLALASSGARANGVDGQWHAMCRREGAQNTSRAARHTNQVLSSREGIETSTMAMSKPYDHFLHMPRRRLLDVQYIC